MTQGLLLVAHGSRDTRAAQVAADVAAAVEAAAPGVAAVAAFLELVEPDPAAALDLLAARGVDELTVQPFLLAHAYHSKVDLPAVAERARVGGRRVRISAVLGPDGLLVDALLRRLGESQPEHAYDGVVVAAAGSSDPAANDMVAETAAALGRRIGLPAVPAYASAATPTVGDAVARLASSGARRVTVASYLLAPGHFAERVRADGLAAGAVAVSRPLGAAPEIVQLVLRRAGLRS
jgi:sirohydrochlorin ferrochelatase